MRLTSKQLRIKTPQFTKSSEDLEGLTARSELSTDSSSWIIISIPKLKSFHYHFDLQPQKISAGFLMILH